MNFYNKMANIYNFNHSNGYDNGCTRPEKSIPLEDRILHEAISHRLPTFTTYAKEFAFIKNVYRQKPNSIFGSDHRISILNYVYKCRQQAIENN
jgi:hypothetical protein